MAITVKHSKVSTIPDGDDSSVVRPSDWNADHTLVGTVPVANGGTGASTLTGYVKGNGTSAMTASATVPSTDVTGLGTMSTQNANNVAITGGTMSGVAITGYIPTTEKAQPLGVATLDAGGKVPQSQIPLMGDLNYQGTWNASTNTPTLTSSVGTKGYYYVVDVSGNTNLNGITDWVIGDWAIFNGSVWQKVDNTDAVTSVNGQVGTVVLTTTNIAEGTNEYFTTARARASVSAGTGISYDSGTGVITNSLPSLGGDVVGPASATDNSIARYDTTTGKLIQNSLVIIDDTGSVTGVNALTAQSLTVNNNATLGSSNTDTLEVNARITTDLEPNTDAAKDIGTSGRNWRDGFFSRNLQAEGKVVSPYLDALNSAGGALRNSSGTPQLQWGSGGGNNLSVDVAININPANAQVAISPSGTGSVTINPATAGTMNNMVIGGTTPLAITGTTITGTSFVGSGASLTNVVNSLTASTGISVSGSTGAVTVTNTAPDQTVAISSGTGISVSGTYPNFTVTNTAPSSGGTVTSVSGTAPIASSGGNTPAISISQSNTSTDGYLSSTDWNTFNGKAPSVTYTTSYIPYGQGTTTPNQSASLTFASSTLTAPIVSASNGLVVNSNTVSASYTIPTGSSAMSAGPMTVASGQTVTVSSGSRWVVL